MRIACRPLPDHSQHNADILLGPLSQQWALCFESSTPNTHCMTLHNADSSSSLDSIFTEPFSPSQSPPLRFAAAAAATTTSIFDTLPPFKSHRQPLGGFGIGVRAPRRGSEEGGMDNSTLTREQRLAARDAPSPPRTTGGASSEGGGSLKLGAGGRDVSGVLTPQSSEVGSSKGVNKRDEEHTAVPSSSPTVSSNNALATATSTSSRSRATVRSPSPLRSAGHSSSHSLSSPIHSPTTSRSSSPFKRHSASQSVSDLSSSNHHSSSGAGSSSTVGPSDDGSRTSGRSSTANSIFGTRRSLRRKSEVDPRLSGEGRRSQSGSSEGDTQPRRRMDVLGLGGLHGRERSRRVSWGEHRRTLDHRCLTDSFDFSDRLLTRSTLISHLRIRHLPSVLHLPI
jgi:hypothetical protein